MSVKYRTVKVTVKGKCPGANHHADAPEGHILVELKAAGCILCVLAGWELVEPGGDGLRGRLSEVPGRFQILIRPYYNLDGGAGRRGYGAYTGGPQRRIGSPLTPAVKGIMIACVAVFLLQIALLNRPGRIGAVFVELFAFTPALAFRRAWLWQMVTYIFLHGNFIHIFFNLFFLWMIGGLVEMRLGTRRFLWLFFVAGVFGALLQGVIFPGDTTVGASASIMGVAAACGALFPEMKILLLFIIPMKMKHFVIVLAAIDIYAASGGGGDVAHFAHLGGLGAGYLFVKFHARIAGWFWQTYYRLKDRFRGSGTKGGSVRMDDGDEHQREVDRILDKIFRESTQSLTKEENEFLKEAGRRFNDKR